MNALGRLDTIAGDFVYALRGVRRNPSLTAMAILAIAIAVGAATSMFGVMRNLLLAPPPHVSEPDRVFRFHQSLFDDSTNALAEPFSGTSYPFYELVSANAETIESAAAYWSEDVPAGTGATSRMTQAVMVSSGFWNTLGANPSAGRFFQGDEAHPARGERVVVLGHSFWQARFGGRSTVIGEPLRIKGQPYTIIGVTPQGFRGVDLTDVDLWLPLYAYADGTNDHGRWQTTAASYNLRLVLRLAAGTTVEQASDELTALSRAFLEETYAPRLEGNPAGLETYRRSRVTLGPVTGGLGDDLQPLPEARVSVWLVVLAFVLVAVAAANVAGLLLLRAMRRRREIAIRLALGVSRARLARQLLTESVVLALFGGLAAMLTVLWGSAWLQRVLLPAMAWEAETLINPAVLAVAGISILVLAVAGGCVPLGYVRYAEFSALRDASGAQLARRPRLQGVLIAVQGALSVALLVGAGLFLKSLHRLETVDIGVERDQSLVVQVDFSGDGQETADVAAFFSEARERVSTIPGVVDVSLSSSVPLRGGNSGFLRMPEGGILSGPPYGLAWVNYVTPEFFRTAGMRIVEGRAFAETDQTGPPVIVINERLAEIGWGDSTEAVGQCVHLGAGETCTTVVGVLADVRSFSVTENDEHASFYVPMQPDAARARALLVRLATGAPRADNLIRQTMLAIDPALPYIRIEALGEVLDPQMRPWRLGASVFTVFGILAIALALIGFWLSVSYVVAQRRHEFAVRIACGARPESLVRLVLKDGIRLALVAVSAGLFVAALASDRIADLLFQVSPRDPAVYAGVAGAVLIVACAASLIPAWRASTIQPTEALNLE